MLKVSMNHYSNHTKLHFYCSLRNDDELLASKKKKVSKNDRSHRRGNFTCLKQWSALSIGVPVGVLVLVQSLGAQELANEAIHNSLDASDVVVEVERSADIRSPKLSPPSPALPQFAYSLQLPTSWDFSDRHMGNVHGGRSVHPVVLSQESKELDKISSETAEELNAEAQLDKHDEALATEADNNRVEPANVPNNVGDLTALKKTISDFASQQSTVIDLKSRMAGILQEFQASEQQWRMIDWGRARELEVALIQQFQTAHMVAKFEDNSGNENESGPGRPLVERHRTGAVVLRGVAAQEQLRNELSNQMILHEEQMRQLNGAQRSLVLGRIRLVQEMNALQVSLAQIGVQNSRFAERYWIHSDPERRLTGLEIRKNLYLLEWANHDDGYAKLTSALLHEKLGEYEYAAGICDELIHKNTPLARTAQVVKVYLRFLQNRDAKKNSKVFKKMLADLHALDVDSLKTGTIFDQWLLVELYVLQGQWANAERQLRSIKKVAQFEMPARRRLAQIYTFKAGASSALTSKALVESQEAFDLEPIPDWFSHAILALALAANKEYEQSIEHLEEAADMASGDQIPLIASMKQASESEQKYSWDLFRVIAQMELNQEQTVVLEQLMEDADSVVQEEWIPTVETESNEMDSDTNESGEQVVAP